MPLENWANADSPPRLNKKIARMRILFADFALVMESPLDDPVSDRRLSFFMIRSMPPDASGRYSCASAAGRASPTRCSLPSGNQPQIDQLSEKTLTACASKIARFSASNPPSAAVPSRVKFRLGSSPWQVMHGVLQYKNLQLTHYKLLIRL